MKWLAPAKINLSLRVLGRRPDGFHELETLMIPLDLADEITVETTTELAGEALQLICTDPSLPTDERNLAYRAAQLFAARVGRPMPKTRIALTKRIPHGAGLGGGSSDAATVLLALNELYEAGKTTVELAAWAAELGSDVPFFVYRSAAWCRGRGEQVEPVPFRQPLPLLLIKPAFPVPTPWAYRQWAGSHELPGVPYSAQRFEWGEMVNDLERPVFEKFVVLAEMKRWLLARSEVAGALMSGSGSTMFAVLRSAEVAQALETSVREEFGDCWICSCATHAPSVSGTNDTRLPLEQEA